MNTSLNKSDKIKETFNKLFNETSMAACCHKSTCKNLTKPCEFHPANNLDKIYTDERTQEEILASEARILSFRFLDIIERKIKKEGLSRKELAQKVGTSPSYITQLFRGDKLINLSILAKMKQALNIEFEIKEKTPYEEQIKNNPLLSNKRGSCRRK